MGSSTSKAARTATSSTIRKYPSRVPPQTGTSRSSNAPSTRPAAETSTGPAHHPQIQASGSRDDGMHFYYHSQSQLTTNRSSNNPRGLRPRPSPQRPPFTARPRPTLSYPLQLLNIQRVCTPIRIESTLPTTTRILSTA
jgi:hypothetical protein